MLNDLWVNGAKFMRKWIADFDFFVDCAINEDCTVS